MDFPVLLNMETPQIYAYSIYSVISEKFEAIVSLGIVNSRYKDFYDIYILASNYELDSKKLACVIARILDDKLGKNITILNISNVSSLADYFVIVTGDSTPQVKALMNETKDKIKEIFSRSPLRVENDARNRWNLLDYGDVVVHILHKEERETYAIEKFWSNAFSINENEWREISKEYSKF